jgi:hypothetical protein
MSQFNRSGYVPAREHQSGDSLRPSAPPINGDMMEAQYEMANNSAAFPGPGERQHDIGFVNGIDAIHAEQVKGDVPMYLSYDEPQTAGVLLPTDFCSGFTRGLTTNPHICTFFANLIPALIIYIIIIVAGVAPIFLVTMAPTLAIVFVISIIFYVFNCYRTFSNVTNLLSVEQASAYCRECSASAPSLRLTVHCYHTEIVTSSTDSVGNPKIKRSSRTVTKHRAHIPIHYDHIVDNGELPDLGKHALTQVKFTKTWNTTKESHIRFNAVQEAFRDQHMDCDSDRTFGEVLTVPGFMDSMTVYVDNDFVPYVVKNAAFCYTVACLCFPLFASWIFQVYLSGISVQRGVKFCKTINVI